MPPIERRFTLSIPRDESEGSWDRYGYWPLSDDCAVAFVADAPVAASRDSGRIIESAIGHCLERGSAEIENALRLRLGAAVVADLATMASDALVREGNGSAYAAVVIAAIHGGEVSVFCRGDCAVYVKTDGTGDDAAILRLSGTTRVDGRVVLPDRTAEKMVADHYEEGVYLGGESRIVEADEVWTVPGRRILMVSDGCEGQGGISKLLAFLKSDDFSKEPIRRLLGESPPRDDLCALGIEVDVAVPAAVSPPREPPTDETAARRTAALETEVAELRKRLVDMERVQADSKARIPTLGGQEAETETGSFAPADSGDFNRPAVDSAGVTPGPIHSRADRISPVRRIFGVLLSLAALAAIGWLSWFLYHQFLDELDEGEPAERDPAAEIPERGESGQTAEPVTGGTSISPIPNN